MCCSMSVVAPPLVLEVVFESQLDRNVVFESGAQAAVVPRGSGRHIPLLSVTGERPKPEGPRA